jgi:hypothetical protein
MWGTRQTGSCTIFMSPLCRGCYAPAARRFWGSVDLQHCAPFYRAVRSHIVQSHAHRLFLRDCSTRLHYILQHRGRKANRLPNFHCLIRLQSVSALPRPQLTESYEIDDLSPDEFERVHSYIIKLAIPIKTLICMQNPQGGINLPSVVGTFVNILLDSRTSFSGFRTPASNESSSTKSHLICFPLH